MNDGDLVLFDGACNLCNAAVRFVAANDPAARFAFASLQSPAAEAALQTHDVSLAGLDSLVLVDAAGAHVRSDAALRIARGLRPPWPLLGALLAMPRPVRDALYDLVARNRYRWFGRRDACAVPTPDLLRRFR